MPFSKWASKDYGSELEFDDRVSGMPIRYGIYSIDSEGKPKGTYAAETKTQWIQLKDQTWVPKKLVMSSTSKKREHLVVIELKWLEVEDLKSRLNSVSWQKLWDEEGDDSRWFAPISSELFPK